VFVGDRGIMMTGSQSFPEMPYAYKLAASLKQRSPSAPSAGGRAVGFAVGRIMIAEMQSDYALVRDHVRACENRCTISALLRQPEGELR
jgi:hypothetical protein